VAACAGSVGEEFRGKLITFIQRLAPLLVPAARRVVTAGSGTPAICASPLDGLGEADALVSIRNEMMSPCLPDEKSW